MKEDNDKELSDALGDSTHIAIITEKNSDSVTVKINGKGGDILNMVASALVDGGDLLELFTEAVITAKTFITEKEIASISQQHGITNQLPN